MQAALSGAGDRTAQSPQQSQADILNPNLESVFRSGMLTAQAALNHNPLAILSSAPTAVPCQRLQQPAPGAVNLSHSAQKPPLCPVIQHVATFENNLQTVHTIATAGLKSVPPFSAVPETTIRRDISTAVVDSSVGSTVCGIVPVKRRSTVPRRPRQCMHIVVQNLLDSDTRGSAAQISRAQAARCSPDGKATDAGMNEADVAELLLTLDPERHNGVLLHCVSHPTKHVGYWSGVSSLSTFLA